LARLATGQARLVEDQQRQKLSQTPVINSLPILVDLVDALVAQGKNDAAQAAFAQWENRVPAEVKSHPTHTLVRCIIWCYLGDFAAIKSASKNQVLDPIVRLHALMITGEQDSILKDQKVAESIAQRLDSSLTMSVSIAYHLSADAAKEHAWRDKAAATLDKGRPDSRRAAAMLRSKDAPHFDEVKTLTMYPPMKCLFVTLLALRFPQQKELAQLAKTLNVSHAPDYYLIEKALK
jgi:hypothetical protein